MELVAWIPWVLVLVVAASVARYLSARHALPRRILGILVCLFLAIPYAFQLAAIEIFRGNEGHVTSLDWWFIDHLGMRFGEASYIADALLRTAGVVLGLIAAALISLPIAKRFPKRVMQDANAEASQVV